MRSLVNGTGQNHHPGATLPLAEAEGTRLRLIAGTGWGLAAPVAVSSPLFYASPALAPGAALPLPEEHEERGAYVVQGGAAGVGSDRLPRDFQRLSRRFAINAARMP